MGEIKIGQYASPRRVPWIEVAGIVLTFIFNSCFTLVKYIGIVKILT